MNYWSKATLVYELIRKVSFDNFLGSGEELVFKCISPNLFP